MLRRRFVAWALSPDNNRAPGRTCMRACAALEDGYRWQRATVPGSKGCGANMRVQPVGLLDVDDDTLAGVAQLQAGMTHGHPTALAAAELTAYAVRVLAREEASLRELPARLRQRCEEQRTVYRDDWLDDLWERPGSTTPDDFVARGWDECRLAIDRLEAALADVGPGGGPMRCHGSGMGGRGGAGDRPALRRSCMRTTRWPA